jgi:uncharacterized protein (TIGR02145 family)
MKKYQTILMVFFLAMSTFAFGQNTIELTFTGDNNGQHVPIDSICIKNLTQGGAVTLYPDDSTLILVITGLSDPGKNSPDNFTIFQNSPNPFNRSTTIEIFIPGDQQITFEVTNLLGRKLTTLQTFLQKGFHNFSFNSGREKVYFLTLHYNGGAKTIKMINSGRSDQNCSLAYSGISDPQNNQKSANLVSELDFTPGDELLMVGYSNGVESGLTDSPESSRTYTIQFARNVACPGLDSLLFADKWYHTIQVLGQCWLKENLDVGMMINGTQTQTNNGIIEKYCYGNNANNCNSEGGLYLWDEIMQYSANAGSRGICPEGWHIPTDNEVKVLEGTADSYIGINSPVWNTTGFRGIDAGKNLKSTSGWQGNGNGTDIYDFKVLPTGYWFAGYFSERTVDGGFWTSSLNAGFQAYYRGMAAPANNIARNAFDQPIGLSVRCLKDL